MTNGEILIKAIKKAKDNGWETNWIIPRGHAIRSVIFSHGFAKAFWGNKIMYHDEWVKKNKEIIIIDKWKWQYHLQQMVIEEKPVKYLKKFI